MKEKWKIRKGRKEIKERKEIYGKEEGKKEIGERKKEIK